MNNVVGKYNSLKSELAGLKEQSARFSGKIESLQQELKNNGFDSIEEASKWLEKSQERERILKQEIEELLVEAERLSTSYDVAIQYS